MWSLHRRLYRAYEIESRVREAGFEVEIVEELTHHAFPFSHFIVYGIGKPLIEHGVLPQSLRDSADRFRGERNSRSLLNPINLGVAVMRSIDKLNDLDRREHDTFVNILVKARRPK
jgi:hypothetical protein